MGKKLQEKVVWKMMEGIYYFEKGGIEKWIEKKQRKTEAQINNGENIFTKKEVQKNVGE